MSLCGESAPCACVQTISKSMAGIVKSLDSALASNNLERVAGTMDQVGKQTMTGLHLHNRYPGCIDIFPLYFLDAASGKFLFVL